MDRRPDTEILVHIEAPSRVLDDSRYRLLASAYLDFRPDETTHLFSQRRCEENGNDVRSSQFIDDGASVSSSSKIGSLRSPQASFGSVLDNANSPRIRTCVAREGGTPVRATQTSWQTPPSVVQDSCPLNHRSAALTSPTRVLENYLQHFDSPSRGIGTVSPAVAKRKCYQSLQQATTAKNQLSASPQMIPCTAQTQATKRHIILPESGDDTQRPGGISPKTSSDDNIIDETIFISSSYLSGASRADSEPPPRIDTVSTSPRALARATSDLGPRSSAGQKIPVTISFLEGHGFTYDSLEIRPPEPPTADLHVEPTGLVTPSLRKLALDVDLTAKFRPTEQARELRPFERGYWLVDCSSWTPDLKRDAWAFLANYVGAGTAGWGVWAKRDTAFQEIRVYCWGIVAAHVFFLLWLSSQRKVRYTGCLYLDSDGQKVIVMGAKQNTKDQVG